MSQRKARQQSRLRWLKRGEGVHQKKVADEQASWHQEYLLRDNDKIWL